MLIFVPRERSSAVLIVRWIAVVVMMAVLWVFATRIAFLQRAVATSGMIEGYEARSQISHQAKSYITLFRYTTSDNRTLHIREANATADHAPLRPEGTAIHVLYDPADPHHAVEDRWSALWTVPSMLLSLATLLLLSASFRFRSPYVERALAR